MEHELLQLLHPPPQEPLVVDDTGILGGGTAHLPSCHESGFVELADLDDCGWMDDLMHLSDELMGGGDDTHAAGTGGGVGSLEDPPPSGGSSNQDGSLPSVEQDDASAGAAAGPKRRDRSKTIVTERKRRVRMKETLYQLRALVPNITKMDKASIIADAVAYLKNLLSHATRLKEEIATLEARPRSPSSHQQQQQKKQNDDEDVGTITAPAGTRVTHVGATQVGDGRFFVTVECEQRDGVAAPLCAAVESLAFFRLENSSLGRSGPDRVVATHVLKASGNLENATIGEGTVRLWMVAALLKEGFQPESTAGIS